MSKMEDVLQKDDRFTLDPRQELSVNLSRVLSKLCRMKSIDEKEKFHLLSSGIAIPRLGGSPEIHKDHLLLTILTIVSTPTHLTSRWIAELLKSVKVFSDYYIRPDSFIFVDKNAIT